MKVIMKIAGIHSKVAVLVADSIDGRPPNYREIRSIAISRVCTIKETDINIIDIQSETNNMVNECLIGFCPKCHTAFEFLGEGPPPEAGCLCPECKKKGYIMVGVIHFEPEKSTLKEAAKELLKYIEENNVTDESCDDGGGHNDQWVSANFGILINNVKEAL